MQQQNNCSNIQLSSKELETKVRQTVTQMIVQEDNSQIFNKQLEKYEKQLQVYSQRKQQLLTKFKSSNKLTPFSSKNLPKITNQYYQSSQFQIQQYPSSPPSTSIQNIKQTNKTNFEKIKENSLSFIPFSASVQQLSNQIYEQNTEITEPKTIKNLIIYQSK